MNGREATMNMALLQLRHGNSLGAIEKLKQVLSYDPNDAEAHAILALSLADEKRLYAAFHEAKIAVSLEPLEGYSHHALGVVQLVRRQFSEAARHLEEACRLEPERAFYRLALADLYRLQAKTSLQKQSLEEALALDPEDTRILCAQGQFYLDRGQHIRAMRFAEEALLRDPENDTALVLKGRVFLIMGEVQKAHDHAIWALEQGRETSDVMGLLCDIKARTNWFLGWWWRWITWMNAMGMTRSIVVLLVAYLIYRFASIAVQQAEHPELSTLITLGWLGICIYTWVSPVLFKRMLKKEIQKVEFLEDF